MDDQLAEVKKIQVVRALQFYVSGKPKEKACVLAGISVSTFDRVRADHPEYVTDFIAGIRAPFQELFEDVVKARTGLIRELVARAAEANLPTKDALAIEARFKEIKQELELELNLLGEEPLTPLPQLPPDNAERFLQSLPPVKLKRGKSIMTVEKTTVTMDLTPDEPVDFIDAETKP